jgi:hypothetical protein
MLLVLSVFLSVFVSCSALNAMAWRSGADFPTEEDFPEIELLLTKPNTAIAFSGGGSRAYTAAMGYLAGLRDLDLLKNIRYIGGISGGAWATTTFTFVQNVSNDEIFLGPIELPQDITMENLKNMDPACARSLVGKNLTLIALGALQDKIVNTLAEAWSYAVSKTYLEPVGVAPGLRFSWSTDMVEDIKSRNPSLMNEAFTIPVNSNRPFPVIGTALVGPTEGAPYIPKTQNYTLMEITPMYVGQMRALDIDYTYKGIGRSHRITVGGAVEPFAFSRKGGSAPEKGIPARETSGLLIVPEPEEVLDLQFSAGTVSYAPGSFLESIILPTVAEKGSMQFEYWAPSTSGRRPEMNPTMYADGGCYENMPLINFMQRRVPKIVLFFLSSVPLMPFEDWNVSTDPYSSDQVTNDLSAFFGALTTDDPRWQNRSFEQERNQVFANEDYATVITALQTAQQIGNGIFATLNLTTIENVWWGIPAGLTFEITFSYLGRLPQWEALLSPEMYDLAVPSEDSEDLSHDVESGPFRHFPHYPTKGGDINAQQANLLADLTGWSILQNSELFRRTLS